MTDDRKQPGQATPTEESREEEDKQKERAREGKDEPEEESKESFPASDPPSW